MDIDVDGLTWNAALVVQIHHLYHASNGTENLVSEELKNAANIVLKMAAAEERKRLVQGVVHRAYRNGDQIKGFHADYEDAPRDEIFTEWATKYDLDALQEIIEGFEKSLNELPNSWRKEVDSIYVQQEKRYLDLNVYLMHILHKHGQAVSGTQRKASMDVTDIRPIVFKEAPGRFGRPSRAVLSLSVSAPQSEVLAMTIALRVGQLQIHLAGNSDPSIELISHIEYLFRTLQKMSNLKQGAKLANPKRYPTMRASTLGTLEALLFSDSQTSFLDDMADQNSMAQLGKTTMTRKELLRTDKQAKHKSNARNGKIGSIRGREKTPMSQQHKKSPFSPSTSTKPHQTSMAPQQSPRALKTVASPLAKEKPSSKKAEKGLTIPIRKLIATDVLNTASEGFQSPSSFGVSPVPTVPESEVKSMLATSSSPVSVGDERGRYCGDSPPPMKDIQFQMALRSFRQQIYRFHQAKVLQRVEKGYDKLIRYHKFLQDGHFGKNPQERNAEDTFTNLVKEVKEILEALRKKDHLTVEKRMADGRQMFLALSSSTDNNVVVPVGVWKLRALWAKSEKGFDLSHWDMFQYLEKVFKAEIYIEVLRDFACSPRVNSVLAKTIIEVIPLKSERIIIEPMKSKELTNHLVEIVDVAGKINRNNFLKKLNMEKILRQCTTDCKHQPIDSSMTARLHAELNVMRSHDELKKTWSANSVRPFNQIHCNKLCCYMCAIALQLRNSALITEEAFHVQGCHQKIYYPWSLPNDLVATIGARLNALLESKIAEVLSTKPDLLLGGSDSTGTSGDS